MTFASDIQIIQGLAGGILIGIASLLLLLGSGKIAGISGIVGNAITHPKQSSWRWLFLLGLLAGAASFMYVHGSLDATLPSLDLQRGLAAALVGIGTRLGSGCTSGHGVCGMGRRSLRSTTATVVFMAAAIITVSLVGR